MCVGPMLLRLAIDLGRRCRRENESRKYVYHVQDLRASCSNIPCPMHPRRWSALFFLALVDSAELSKASLSGPGLSRGRENGENSLRDFMWSRGQ
jgi:hypothetical protein